MVLKKGDFVEVEFTGKIKDGSIFDSNIKEDLEKAKIKGSPKPFVFPLGERMFVKGVDNFLIGKDIGEHHVELKPEDAFGKRDPKLIQTIPMKLFQQQRLNPIPGSMFNFDGKLGKILTVSSGRVMVDFNNPIAGKNVEYKIKVNKKVDSMDEKIKAMNDFFFREDFDFKVNDKELVIEVSKEKIPFVKMFEDKYKEILGLTIKAIEAKEK